MAMIATRIWAFGEEARDGAAAPAPRQTAASKTAQSMSVRRIMWIWAPSSSPSVASGTEAVNRRPPGSWALLIRFAPSAAGPAAGA